MSTTTKIMILNRTYDIVKLSQDLREDINNVIKQNKYISLLKKLEKYLLEDTEVVFTDDELTELAKDSKAILRYFNLGTAKMLANNVPTKYLKKYYETCRLTFKFYGTLAQDLDYAREHTFDKKVKGITWNSFMRGWVSNEYKPIYYKELSRKAGQYDESVALKEKNDFRLKKFKVVMYSGIDFNNVNEKRTMVEFIDKEQEVTILQNKETKHYLVILRTEKQIIDNIRDYTFIEIEKE